jgi:hypothetical protein
MTHIRSRIRSTMKSVLVAALPSGKYQVFASRKYSLNTTAQATIDIGFQSDDTESQMMGKTRKHTATLFIRCQRVAAETAVDDLLDADEILINAAIQAYSWSALLEEQPELTRTVFADDASTGTVIAAIVLQYDLDYRAAIDDLETVRT